MPPRRDTGEHWCSRLPFPRVGLFVQIDPALHDRGRANGVPDYRDLAAPAENAILAVREPFLWVVDIQRLLGYDTWHNPALTATAFVAIIVAHQLPNEENPMNNNTGSKLNWSRAALVLTALASLASVTALSGCASMARAVNANYGNFADKVVRLKVDDRWYAAEIEDPKSGERFGRVHWGAVYGKAPAPGAHVPYRWTEVRASGHWTGGGINGPLKTQGAIVADGVPLLKDGDWVDVYVYDQDTWDIANRHYLTVLRLVCREEDEACQTVEAAKHGKPDAQVIYDKGAFDINAVSVTPSISPSSAWLPGREPAPR